MAERSSDKKAAPSSVLAVDLGRSATKLVHAKRGEKGPVVLAVHVDEPYFGSGAGPEEKLVLPRGLKSKHVALGITHRDLIIRILSFSSGLRSGLEERIRSQMNIGNDYRISYELQHQTPSPSGGSDSEYLIVSVPNREARRALALAQPGPPFAMSLESSGIASLKAFSHNTLDLHLEESVAVLEAGAEGMMLAMFARGELCLVKTFTFSESTLGRTVQRRLGTSAEEARGIILDGSFDISEIASEVLRPFTEQLKRSGQYVQHKYGLTPSTTYASGGFAYSPFLVQAIEQQTGMEVRRWNPFDSMEVQNGALPDYVTGQEGRFAAAMGLALNALEGSE